MKVRFVTWVAMLATALSLLGSPPVSAGGRGHGRGHGHHLVHDGWGFRSGHGGWHRHRHHHHHDRFRAHWFGATVFVHDPDPYWGWDRPFWGSVVGGLAGAVIGSGVGRGAGRTAAIVGGAVIGSAVGGSLGRYMDDVDRLRLAQTLETVPSGRAAAWENPDRRTRYEVAPIRTFQRDDGRYCREYQTRALVGGGWQQLYGTACRQPDGSWELQR